MQPLEITFPIRQIKGSIQISGSKSISNRALLIRALGGENFDIDGLSDSNDTRKMMELLSSNTPVLDAGDAGTVMRFMTAYLSRFGGECTITGSQRMQERPIGPLVDALRQLGADIEYLGREGCPPLAIRNPSNEFQNRLYINASVSSQYISALMMIGPTLPSGLEIQLEGHPVSEPYIRMTAGMMSYFGIEVIFDGNTISIPAKSYALRTLLVEPDWSSVSYFYGLAALSESAEIHAPGFQAKSWQGDAVVSQLFELLGVETKYTDEGIILFKSKQNKPIKFMEYDFIGCPDLFQTVSVTCAGLGIPCLFTGLDTLSIKETDRISALSQELAKWNVFLTKVPEKFSKKSKSPYFMQEGRINKSETAGIVETFGDHRMAMSMSMLSMIAPVTILNPGVVDKSFVNYWNILESLGARIQE